MEERVIKAALLGLGTVGTGVYKVLKNQEEEMTAKLGCKVKISRILVRNLEKAARKLGDDSLLTNDWKEIVAVAGIIGLRAALTFLIHWEIKEEKNHS